MSPSLAASKRWFENSSRFTDAPALKAVRESLPWSLAGLVAGLPVFLMLAPLATAVIAAFGVMGIALAAILGCKLAAALRLWIPAVAVAAVLAFCFSLPHVVPGESAVTYAARAGRAALFVGMIAGLAAAGICVAARRFVSNDRVADVLGAVLLVAIAAALFAANLSLANGMSELLAPMARMGDSLTALLVIVFVEMALWLVGVHGPATLAAVVTPVYLTMQMQNTGAHFAHRPLPYIVVVSLFLFVFPGGAGATLPLTAMLSLSKVKRLRTIGRLTILPALCNINDPLVVGLPLVMNPYLAVPFVVVPLCLATVTYLAVAHGLVARPAIYMPSMVPSLVSTIAATLDWRAAVLLLFNVALAAAMYWPFFRAYELAELASTSSAALRQAQGDTVGSA